MLSSHGWEKSIQEDDNFAAIDRLVIRFTLPLQADTTVIKAEFGNMIEYAVHIGKSLKSGRVVWHRSKIIFALIWFLKPQTPFDANSQCSH